MNTPKEHAQNLASAFNLAYVFDNRSDPKSKRAIAHCEEAGDSAYCAVRRLSDNKTLTFKFFNTSDMDHGDAAHALSRLIRDTAKAI